MRWLLVVLLVGCDCSESETPTVTPAQAPQPPPAEVEWLKGQLHMHTEFSGDSETPLQEALDWYANADFDFVVVTDHNHVTVGEHRDMLVLPGAELTQNLRRCVPAPEVGNHCALHVNALVVDPRREGFVRMQRFGIPSREDVLLRVGTREEHRFEFIGRGGETLRTERGTEATFELSDVPSGGYVRAVVIDDAGKRAWTQPVFAP